MHSMTQAIKRIEALTEKDIKRVFKGTVLNRTSRCLEIVPILFASLMEEIGEFCQAVKVEEQVVLHKKLDEPSYVEAIDIFICGYLVYFALGGDLKEIVITTPLDQEEAVKELVQKTKSDPSLVWKTMMTLHSSAGFASFLIGQYGAASPEKLDQAKDKALNAVLYIITFASELYAARKGSFDDFESIMSAKLDKWDKNQNEREGK